MSDDDTSSSSSSSLSSRHVAKPRSGGGAGGSVLIEAGEALFAVSGEAGAGKVFLGGGAGTSAGGAGRLGGEKCLASISLAFGLAEVMQERAGGIVIETLFIDEGSGSLDSDAMKRVLEVLEAHRQVGVISHIATVQPAISSTRRHRARA